jgi:hypothetical protein
MAQFGVNLIAAIVLVLRLKFIAAMTPAERDRMNLLSMLIQCERDYMKYIAYVKEINELMSQKEKRLQEAERRVGPDNKTADNSPPAT